MPSQWLTWMKHENFRKILLLVLSGISLLVSLADSGTMRIDAAWVAIVLCGIPILKDAAVGLYTRFDIKADLLVSLALIASVIIGEIFAAGEVAFIMQIGSFLEESTVARAQAGIEKLIRLTPRIARRLIGGNEEMVPAEAVEVGETRREIQEENITVEGIILHSKSYIDKFFLIGE